MIHGFYLSHDSIHYLAYFSKEAANEVEMCPLRMRFSYRLKTERRVKSQIQVGYRHGGTVAVVDNLSHVRDAYL
jgi:hypothetical protein